MNLGFGELLLILAIALIVFGPDKLPDIGKHLGRAVRSFRSASAGLKTELQSSLDLDEPAAQTTATRPDVGSADADPLPPPPPPVFEDSAQPAAATANSDQG